MNCYEEFLNSKAQLATASGFAPKNLPPFLFDFQASIVDWALRQGRAAIFADCGLGKSAMQLAWCEQVVRYTNKPVLLLTPLAVAGQFVKEGEKFGIELKPSYYRQAVKNVTEAAIEAVKGPSEKQRAFEFAGRTELASDEVES